MISAAMGRSFEIECNHRTCTDKEITVMIKSTVPPGYEETWARVYSNGKKIKFISEKKLVKAIKRAFSSKEMDINKEGEKILAPFVKDKIRILKEEMLKKSTVAPKKNYWGTVVIKTPDDKKEMTIEVTLGDETHKINYNLISLK